MSTAPDVGLLLGTFESVVPGGFTADLDAILGLEAGPARTTVVPGALVFFAFLPDLGWMAAAGISFDRSLAVRRHLRVHDAVHVGDRLHGRSLVTDVSHDRQGRPRRFVTIGTDYRRDGELVLEEAVTYVTTYEARS